MVEERTWNNLRSLGIPSVCLSILISHLPQCLAGHGNNDESIRETCVCEEFEDEWCLIYGNACTHPHFRQ